MKAILDKLIEYQTLTQQEAEDVLRRVAAGEFNNSQIASFLTVYMMRSVSVEELTGFRNTLQELCLRVDLSDFETIDLCGTGGDGKNTFNISTLSSFVAAGAGVKVSKHGNYGVSSASGSSNVMEALGYQFTNDTDKLKRQIDEAGICFLHAPLFHPAMKAVGPVRKELKMRTFFNMLGPLVNPSFPQKQIVGVFNLELARLYHYMLQQSGKDYVILHSLDVYDEISLTAAFKLISNSREEILQPFDIGLNQWQQSDLFGGDTVDEAAAIFKKILNGDGTQAQNEAVFANAGMAIHCYKGVSIEQGIEEAKASLLDGKAKKVLEKLIERV